MSHAAPDATTSPKKSLAFRIGVGLLILYAAMWLSVVAVPFLPLSIGAKAGLATGIGVAAEIIFLIAIALLGKETYRAITARFRRRRGKPVGAASLSEMSDDAGRAQVGEPVDAAVSRSMRGADDR